MKRKLWSLMTALALCGGLMIPAAFAEESPDIPMEEALSNIQLTFDQANGTQYNAASEEADAFLVPDDGVLSYEDWEDGSIVQEDIEEYYAIRSNSTFTVSHIGTQDDGSAICIYLNGLDKTADGGYYWEDYPHNLYLTGSGEFLNDAIDPTDYGGLVELHAGESVQFQIPTDWWDSDTLYRLQVTIYYPQYDWSYWRWAYFKVDEAGVVSGLSELDKPTTASGFSDVAGNAWYAKQVKWAVEKGITGGTSATTFSPDQTCTTAQILTFLWRAAGSPEPTIANPFTDVTEADYFFKPAVWAHEKGLVSGSALNGNTPCTRSATVTYLWKLAGAPETKAPAFVDVAADASYAQAVQWAVENGITGGVSATQFGPDNTCTRGQIVTFLYADFAE